MARKAGQTISHGHSTGSSASILGAIHSRERADTTTRPSTDHFREAHLFLNLKLQQREIGRVSRAAVMSLNQLIESPDIFHPPWKAFRYLWI
jgi:hypothetical protein